MPLILRTHASAVSRNLTCVAVNQMASTCGFCHSSALGKKKYGPRVPYLCNMWVGTRTGFTGFAASDMLSLEFWSGVKLGHGSDQWFLICGFWMRKPWSGEFCFLFKVNGKLHFIAVGGLTVGLFPVKPWSTFLSRALDWTGCSSLLPAHVDCLFDVLNVSHLCS